jgi:D-alanine-D-alanine ligase
MHIAIVHDRIKDIDAPDAIDVFHQTDAVETALGSLGHTSVRIDCSLDLSGVRHLLEQSGADLAVNLVESIEGKGRLIHLFPFLLDSMGMPYTGACAEAILLTSNKVLAKQWMAAANIPTPPWITISGKSNSVSPGLVLSDSAWIIKSVWEHASIGLDDTSIVGSKNSAEIRDLLDERADRLGGLSFAEAFIEGREFNLSILAGDRGPQVLPPAEIIFEDYPVEMPKNRRLSGQMG